MATGRPIDTDLIYLARDASTYRVTWSDFQSRTGVEENDLALIYRPSEQRSFAVRVGDLWNASAQIEESDMFIVERGIRGAFDPDNPDDPSYFGRLFHANPVVLRYIAIELNPLPSDPLTEPTMKLTMAAYSYGGGYARLIEPDGTETAIATTRTEYPVSGAGTYLVMGEFTVFEIDSDFQVGAGTTETEVWNSMMVGDQIGKNLFSNIASLVSVPSGEFKVKELHYLFPHTGMDFDSAEVANWDTSEATTAAFAFYNTTGNPDISNWDLSNVENMYRMFARSADFDGYFDMSGSNVIRENLAEMFSKAASFNNQQWAASVSSPNGATNLHKMFDGAAAFNQPFGSNALIKDAVDMSYMFANTGSFNQDFPNWDISGVVSAKGMFHGAVAFNAGGLIVNPDESHSNTWSNQYVDFFRGTQAYNTPLNGWDFTNTFDLSGLFQDAVAFNSPDSSAWNIETVQTFNSMFANTAAFNQPLDEWETLAAVEMDSMFENAAVFDQNISSWCVLGVAEEPDNFAVGSPIEGVDEYQPKWGTCPPKVVRELKIYDKPTNSYTDTEVGHEINTTSISLDPHYRSADETYELNFDDGKGWIRVSRQASSSFKCMASWSGARLRLKNTYYNPDFYPEGVVHYSNELKIAVSPNPVDWFGFVHNNPTAITLFTYATVQVYDTTDSEWKFVEFTGDEKFGEVDIPPGVDCRLDTTFNFPMGSGGFVEFRGKTTDSDLTIHTWSSLGAMQSTARMFWNVRGWVGCNMSFLDVSKIVNASNMFSKVDTTLSQLDVTGWNWQRVESFNNVFANCTKIQTVRGLDTWTFGGNLKTVSGTFSNCTQFNQDLSGWTLGNKVNSANGMFRGCKNFNSPIPQRSGAAGRFNANATFYEAVNFNQAVDGWDTNLHDAAKMFYGATRFNHPSISNLMPNKVENMNEMFFKCTTLDQDVGNLGRHSSNIFNIQGMFRGCHSLSGIGGFANWKMPNCKYFKYAFMECRNLQTGTDFTGWEWSSYGTESNTKRLGEMTSFFYNIKATTLQGLETWDMTRIGDMKLMFAYATNFNDPSIANWDCSNCSNVSEMFTQGSVQQGHPEGKFNQDISTMKFPRITSTYQRNDVFRRNEIETNTAFHPKWGQK